MTKRIWLLMAATIFLLVGCGASIEYPPYEPQDAVVVPAAEPDDAVPTDDGASEPATAIDEEAVVDYATEVEFSTDVEFPTYEPKPPTGEDAPEALYPPPAITLTNPQVRWVVEPLWAFDDVFQFSEGMAGVEYYDHETVGWEHEEHILGYVNRHGEIVIPIIHRHWRGFYSHRGAPPFSNGLVAVQSNEHNGVGVFDTYGHLIVPFSFADAWMFSEGLMAVLAPAVWDEAGDWYSAGPGWGFIDTSGELVIDFQFGFVSHFQEGRAAVWSDDRSGMGFIDTSGDLVIDYEFAFASSFWDGRAAVMSDDGRWGFINHAGEVVIPFQFNSLTGQADSTFTPRFSEGLAAVNTGETWDLEMQNTWGYINIYGEMVIPAIYSHAMDFSNGFAWVLHNEYGWGIIDKEGNFTVRAFPALVPSHNDAVLTPVRIDDLWGFQNEEDVVIVPIKFCEVRNFSEGLAWVRQGRWWGIIEIVD